MKKSVTARTKSEVLPAPFDGDGNAEAVLNSKVESYFHRYGRPARGSRILVAVSGGADSVSLLQVLAQMSKKSGWELGVAHVDHGLRGKESEGDCEFVRRLAKGLRARFHSRRLDPKSARTEHNDQAWGRSERYTFFDSIAKRHNYSHIALAHQLNDRAETVAAAVLAAAGTFALSGIPPVRGKIIRPLFDASRHEIMSYLTARKIPFRTDSSNAATKYQRNRIRNVVLPQWAEENPAIIEGLARLGEQLSIQRRYLEEKAKRVVENSSTSPRKAGMTFRAAALTRHDPALDPYIVRELVSRLGLDILPGAAIVSRFSELRSWRVQHGTYALEQGEFAIRVSQGVLKVYKKRVRTCDVGIENDSPAIPTLETRVVTATAAAPLRSDDKILARFDLEAVQGEVSVRWPQPGDRYQPVGLLGTKKLSDLLADRKVPSFERPLVPVVVDKLGILWPIGHPIAHRARLTDRTRRVMEARLQEGSWKNRS